MTYGNHEISIKIAVLGGTAYFLILLIATAIDIVVWRKLTTEFSNWLNIITMIALNIVFFKTLENRSGFEIRIFRNTSFNEIILAVGCAVLFYFLLDKFLDPIFESIFSKSEANFQEQLDSLRRAPMTSFIRVCLIAPIVEEVLMRGYVLGGLSNKYGIILALLVSAILFALLHFNMVQTLSALICGLILGILYIYTGSIFTCILAHALYNTISYFTTIYSIY